MGRVCLGKLGLWALVIVLLIQVRGYNGCFEEERIGLLQLKQELLNSNCTPPVHVDAHLPTWVEHPESIDCCRWERVGCDRITGHVTELSLDNVRRISELFLWNYNCSFNVSVFAPFKELRSLNLSSNGFASRINDEDFKLLSKFNKLRQLDLSHNYFNKHVLRILGVLPSLKFLSLNDNYIEESVSNQDLTYNQSNLEVLLLSSNYLNGSLPMEGLASFRYLKTLDLSHNEFSGSIPPSISALSSLKFLSLADNRLNGSLPIKGLCELKKLEELDLSSNYFEGIPPPCLCNLRSIRLLDLSLNEFRGNISSSLLGSLNSLEYIDLSYNRFEGLFSFSSFANHSMLEVVAFTSVGKVEIETEYTDWVPMIQLKVLMLSNCNLNNQSGEIPKFLLHQHQLRVLDLSHNNLKGSFPNWLLVNNTELVYLSLRSNSFFGLFHLLSGRYPNTSWIDVSDNHLSGQLQVEMGEMLPRVKYVNLSGNAFEGGIPSSIGKMGELETLDLSSNNLFGEVPNQLVRNCTSLRYLTLSNNNFHGQIFSALWINWATIESLKLNNNQFEGPLTNVVYSLPSLYFLDISNNYMSGEIPNSMDNITSLWVLIMRNNSFEGQFPCALVPQSFMDISDNSFFGSFASCSNRNFLSLVHVHLQRNKFDALILQDLTNLSGVSRSDMEYPALLTLDISENNMSGIIPDSITALSGLKVLLLRGNQLGGSIPTQLCQLNEINLIDLSNNFFTGSIPRCFNNITFGAIETEIGAEGGTFWTTGDENGNLQEDEFEIYSFYKIYLPGVGYRGSLVYEDFSNYITEVLFFKPDDAEFVTKNRISTYQGSILGFMSGLDLSQNQLTGEIPSEFGKLSTLRALNLSHNHLSGSIPKTFSNLTLLESLDLSYNSLSGNIPSELIDLNFLAVFTVAHNNLSGKIPDGKEQFGTFDASSYEGNPFLRGPPLEKNFTTIVDSPTPSSDRTDEEGIWYDIDPLVFSMSFASTYFIFLLGFVTGLYINPYWRRRWFYLIEEALYSSYYFLSDTLCKLSGSLFK